MLLSPVLLTEDRRRQTERRQQYTMTGAMYAAISGLKSHMNKLNVIGNNIANVNTYGYKAGRVVFQDSLYTTMRSGSNGTPTVGGRNPAQIGYGAEIGSIDLDMSTGNYSPTGRAMDCMIKGDGFFLVGDKTVSFNADDPASLKNATLTRVGSFDFSADGYLTDINGKTVYGFLNSVNDAGEKKISDQLVPIHLPRTDKNGKILFPKRADGTPLADQEQDADGKATVKAQLDSISIDEKTGKITGVTKDSSEVITLGYIAMGNVTNPGGVTHESGPYYRADEGAGDLAVSLMGGAAELAGIKFVNGSLSKDPDNAPAGMKIGSAGTTSLITGGLEMSKTDLATEISEMITTQRGYQANTRIITVTDSMLEELVNIKR